jgi:hypothetical protein
MKVFVEFPFLAKWRRKEITSLPLSGGLQFSWLKYEFKYGDNTERLPRGPKKGTHVFSISIGFSYWWVQFKFYR